MIRLITIIALFFSTAAGAQYSRTDFAALKSLEGHWEMKTRRGAMVEEWKVVSDTLLQGRSYLLVDGDTIPQETIVLSFNNGAIVYTPTVLNQNNGRPVPFALASINEGQYNFENQQHDFPQKISYRPVDVVLSVTISGGKGKEYKEIPFHFVKR